MKLATYLLAFLLLFSVAANAQEKIVESSAKKMPAWIGMAGADYFTVSATAPTLEEAQQKCMADVKQNIITAIAANITSSEQYLTAQISRDELTNVFEKYASDVKTQGALLPFLTGVSLTKATDIYWEKHYVKKEKRYYYVYYINYPFPTQEREKWTCEFLQKDKAQYDKYLTLKEQFGAFTNIEFIELAVGELETLAAYFFDSVRKNEVKTLQQNYYQLYSQISVQPVSQALGESAFYLTLAGRPVVTAKTARTKSETATEISVKPLENKLYQLTYSYEGCVDEDENKIELSYNFGGRGVKYTFYFNVKENKMYVTPKGAASVQYLYEKGDSTVTAVSVRFQLNSKYENEFIVQDVTLHIPQVQEEISSGILNQTFKGKGLHQLTFECPLQKAVTEAGAFLLDGMMNIKNVKTGQVNAVSLKIPYQVHK